MPTQLPLHASVSNLRRVALIRLIVVAGQLGGILYARFWLRVPMEYAALLTGVALLAALTALTFWRLRWRTGVTDAEFFAQLVCDISLLSLMLYYSGGITNPFVSYYLVPICISAALLPVRLTAALAALSLSAHSLLLVEYQPMPFLMPTQHGDGPHLHLLGMWLEFAISAALIGFFVSRMAAALRVQQQELNLRREEALRQQQLVAVATLAAGTAHELATPLATMTVLLDELIADQRHSKRSGPSGGTGQSASRNEGANLDADLELLKNQVDGCRDTLAKLVATAETHQRGGHGEAPVNTFVRQALDRWLVMRPRARYQWEPDQSDAAIAADPVLEQALLNLLNNAADANGDSPAAVELQVAVAERRVRIQVLDRGDYRELPAQPFSSTKPDGLGLGLFLSRAAAQRYGGGLRLQPRPAGGTIAELELPTLERGAGPREGI